MGTLQNCTKIARREKCLLLWDLKSTEGKAPSAIQGSCETGPHAPFRFLFQNSITHMEAERGNKGLGIGLQQHFPAELHWQEVWEAFPSCSQLCMDKITLISHPISLFADHVT